MFFLLFLLLLGAVADDLGFGGAVVEDAADVAPDDLPSRPEFPAGAQPPTTPTPTPTSSVPPAPKTKLELELEKARIDPAQHPLVMLRVEVARLVDELKEKEARGLSAARDVEARLEAARGLLGDAERVGLHRMMVCATRTGRGTSLKNYRMTAAGPVRLSNAEILSQTNVVDPEGCARIDLVDEALLKRLRRAHEVKTILLTVSFPYHRIAERRALEQELKSLEKQLAQEDLPVLSMPGMKDPY